MYLADEFYLIAHEDNTGRPRLHSKTTGYGLAAALLAELFLHGNVAIDRQTVNVVSTLAPQDLLAHTVLEHLLTETQRHPIRDWLAFLGRTATEDVAKRLTRIGVLELVESRRLWTVTSSYQPIAMNEAAWPYARLSTRLAEHQEMNLPDQILTGLAFATGLTRAMVFEEAQQAGRAYLSQVVAQLPPPMRILVSETEIAISKTAANRG